MIVHIQVIMIPKTIPNESENIKTAPTLSSVKVLVAVGVSPVVDGPTHTQ